MYRAEFLHLLSVTDVQTMHSSRSRVAKPVPEDGCNVEITRCYTVPRFAIARTIAVFPPADGTLSRRNETLRRGKWSSRRAIDGPVNNGRLCVPSVTRVHVAPGVYRAMTFSLSDAEILFVSWTLDNCRFIKLPK